jgi:uncharacterized protein (TIRG00374 family)
MSFRTWLSIFTVVLLGLVIFFARKEIAHAWMLLETVNIWLLLLLIPGQAFVYYAAGEMVFSYLRVKESIKNVSGPTLMRMALEMNFVNHILPSGGVSGVSYMNWRLGHFGVSAGRATMAQVVRYAAGFAGFITLLFVSVLIVTIDSGVNRWVILFSSFIVGLLSAAIVLVMYLLSGRSRTEWFSHWIYRAINKVVRKLSFGRKRQLFSEESITLFFEELHRDYQALSQDKKMLLKPFIWSLIFTAGDALLFMITFWALGVTVNPAVVLIAYGVASFAAFFVLTPGGTGAYEAIMVSVFTIAGMDSSIAIAGTVLTRVILVLGTIGFGYLFYQYAILKYGKNKDDIPTL